MFFIKPCPACGKKIRFPLDKGKIKVTCVCGHSFIADPDNTSLFKDGKFDLGDHGSRSSFSLKRFRNIPGLIIQKFINATYTIQNFKLLPVAEQRKIVLYALLYIALIVGIIYILSLIQCNTQSTIQPHTI